MERHGWKLLRINGSHHIYGREGSPVHLSVPIHAEVEGVLPRAKLTPQEAEKRILECRPRHILPEGATIWEMIDFGRA